MPAKKKKILLPSPKKVLVKSKTYGHHTREPRGSQSEAKLNTVLDQNSKNAPAVSGAAKPVHRYLKMCEPGFISKGLWFEMMRRLFRAGSVEVIDLLKSIRNLEVNPSYQLQLLTRLPKLLYHKKGKKLTVEMTLVNHPVFSKVDADSYYYELHLLWIDDSCQQYEGEAQETVWLSAEDELAAFDFHFQQPAWARYGVVLLKLIGGNNEKPCRTFKAVGMQVVDVMDLGSSS
ncbi:MAG: hypothetical protein ACO1OO_09915 [Flavisolibacter sp.]